MNHYLTLVFNTSKMVDTTVEELTSREDVSAMAWDHVLDDRKKLQAALQKAKDALEFVVTHHDSTYHVDAKRICNDALLEIRV